jgi:hypothetical protein
MRDLIALLFGKNKKSKKMDITEKNLDEARAMYSGMDFQWIKGDDALSIENFKGINLNGETAFIEFTSGKRINMDLLDEFMTYFPSQPKAPEPVPVAIESVPRQEPRVSRVTEVVYQDHPSTTADVDSPIYKLLRKQKKNIVEVSIKMKLNLPPKELYGVLSSSFDDADNEIINFVLDGVDIDDIKASLAESIKKSYYSIGSKQESEKPASAKSNRKNSTGSYEE